MFRKSRYLRVILLDESWEWNVVIMKLHDEVDAVLIKLATARVAGLPYETYLHRVHLQGLLETAGRYGVDPDAWIDRSTLPPLTLSEA